MREDRAVVSVGANEIEQARVLQERVEQLTDSAPKGAPVGVAVGTDADHHVTMPPELAKIIIQIVELVGRGCTVTVGSMPNELTTTAAAQMLHMSRPTLMKLVAEGKIAAHKVGTHTRLFSRDVIAYREKQLKAQSEAFEELRAFEEEHGIID